MSKKQKKNLLRIIVSAVLFIIACVPTISNKYIELAAFLTVYAIIGWDIIWKAIRNIFKGQVFDENFLMAIATIGAMVLGEYKEGVMVILLYQIGEWFQSYAVGRSRRSIAGLMDIRPDHANRKLPDGTLKKVSPEEIAIGDVIVVKPGERVPLDGIVLEGASSFDTAALTGESAPRDVYVGDDATSGFININGTITVEVSKIYGESTVSKILNLVENSSSKKAKAENFITRFARYYTPFVCFAALALAIIPPLITGQDFAPWVYRALTFLVISCPCALVISVPLSFFGGIGGASKIGVLVKGSNYLEALAKIDTVVFDKTGTLTKGAFEVSEIYCKNGFEKDEVLRIAAYAENYSNHPIATSIRNAFGKKINPALVAEVEEIAGHGVQALIDGKQVLVGNSRMMTKAGIKHEENVGVGTVLHLAVEGEYAGCILVEDVVKPDAKQAIEQLKQEGVGKTVMLTGDRDAVGQRVAKQLGIAEVYTELLPADKVEKVEEILSKKKQGSTVAFVGDGINDAPVLARVDVGIAMGGLGADAAIEAADVVIMTDEPSKIPAVMGVARKTMSIVKQNIVFALAVKAAALILGALGYVDMGGAVFADVGVSIIAILNAMRALRTKKIHEINAYSSKKI